MTSGPFIVLDTEHNQIRIVLTLLQELADQVEHRPVQLWLSTARSAVDWLETYNTCHHRKEELVLSLLQEKGLANGELARFWKDHQQGELVFGHLGTTLEALRQGDLSARAKIKRLLEVLLVKYREHMEGEEELLFPAARLAINKEDRDLLVTQFDLVDGEMFRRSSQVRLEAMGKAIYAKPPTNEEASRED